MSTISVFACEMEGMRFDLWSELCLVLAGCWRLCGVSTAARRIVTGICCCCGFPGCETGLFCLTRASESVCRKRLVQVDTSL